MIGGLCLAPTAPELPGLLAPRLAQADDNNSEFDVFDEVMHQAMARQGLPGGTLAIVKDGRLVFARGYGLVDTEGHQAAQPDSLFRVASISKIFTAVAIMQLAESGALDLDASAFGLLSRLQPPPGRQVDPRINSITIRQLLVHAGGWDAERSGDPLMRVSLRRAALSLPDADVERPETVVRYMLGQPLDFDPGTKSEYSNFGYVVLGLIIEAVSGESYETYVRDHVLAPAGVVRARLGRTALQGRAEGEARYYVSEEETGFTPYDHWSLEAGAAAGGWIASAVDLARLMSALDGSRGVHLIRPESLQSMLARPAPPIAKPDGDYYGFALIVQPRPSGLWWFHTGGLVGARSEVVHGANGLTWAYLFNGEPADDMLLGRDVDAALIRAASRVSQWPTTDAFANHR